MSPNTRHTAHVSSALTDRGSQLALWQDESTTLAGPVRICHNCGQEFIRVKGMTGAKYCGPSCQSAGYRQGVTRWRSAHPLALEYICGACKRHFTKTPHAVCNSRFGQPAIYLCEPCTTNIRHVLNRMRNHRAPSELIYRVARGELTTCPVCGVNLTTPQRVKGGEYRILMVVDHDHACCPGQVSKCGRCIRGLLCNRCNMVAGALGESADLAAAMAAHLAARHV